MYDEEEETVDNEEDLYAILNLSPSASAEDIKNSFRRLSLIFHPDKHTDPVKKREAEQLFQKIKNAHDILSNPEIRILYDNHGMHAVNNYGKEVAIPGHTSTEILAKYEMLRESNRTIRALRSTTTKFIIGFDMTDLFDRYIQEDSDDRYLAPEIGMYKMSAQQNVNFTIADRNDIFLTGLVKMINGRGEASMNLNWRRHLAPWLNSTYLTNGLSYSADDGIELITSVSHVFTPKVTAALGTKLRYYHNQRILRFHPMATLDWNISSKIHGSFIATIDKPSFSTSITWTGNQLSTGLTSSVMQTEIVFRLFATYNLESIKTRIHASSTLRNLAEPHFKFGITKQVTTYTSLGMAVTFSELLGTHLSIKVTCGNQHYIIPVILSEDINPVAITYGASVPVLLYFIIRRLLYDPWCQQREEKNEKAKREKQNEAIEKAAMESKAARDLMTTTSLRIKSKEMVKGGLVIVQALYGSLVGYTEVEDAVDVTIAVQIMVEDSRLQLPPCYPPSSRSSLQGFHDPCPSREKALHIVYRFHDMLHEVTVKDSDSLAIPMQKHILENGDESDGPPLNSKLISGDDDNVGDVDDRNNTD